MAEHITIDGSEYCLMGNGLAARITMQTATELIVLTDDTARATWDLGGTWDSGATPWYAPTPNPLELELTTRNPRWNPNALNFYNPRPLTTILTVWLAERDTFGYWYTDRRARGIVLSWRIEPTPAGARRVTLAGVDATTSMSDATLEERAEESPLDRAMAIVARVKGLYPQLQPTITLPILGRYHPSLGLTALELLIDTLTAARRAVIFWPYVHATDPTIHTVVFDLPLDQLGAPGGTFLASTDPAAGAVDPGAGSHPYLGANTLTACVDAIALEQSDRGYRTRIDVSRTVAEWVAAVYQGGAGSLPPNSYLGQWPIGRPEVGERWELTLTGSAPGTITGTGNSVWRPFANPHNPSQGLAQGTDYLFVTSTQPAARFVWDAVVPGIETVIGRFIIVPAGNALGVNAGMVERLYRPTQQGPTLTVTRGAAEESANGIRALTGYRSPIKQQNDLGSWAAAALNIVTGAKLYPSAFRTTSSKAHPSPGARQWALHLQAGHRLAIALDTTTNPPPFFPAVTPWVVALRFTLEPDTFTLDLTCAPPTGAN